MSNRPVSIVGYWASQEQYSMQDLLKFVTEAEHGGFKPVSYYKFIINLL
jgi:hypothetical protein